MCLIGRFRFHTNVSKGMQIQHAFLKMLMGRSGLQASLRLNRKRCSIEGTLSLHLSQNEAGAVFTARLEKVVVIRGLKNHPSTRLLSLLDAKVKLNPPYAAQFSVLSSATAPLP